MTAAAEALRPPSRTLLLLEGRAVQELGAFWMLRPWLAAAPRGDGHPVLVFPGLMASDLSTRPLRGFLKAQGYSIGSSLCENDMVDKCAQLLASGKSIHLPSDIVALGPGGKIGDPSAGGDVRQLGVNIPDGWMGLDIGPGTAAEFSDVILDARTVLWNGPMGVFEDPRFEAGTRTVAQAVAETKGFSVIGGGDSASAVKQFGYDDQVDWVSTGGGASLELIEQGDLPGLVALRNASNAPA